MAKVFGVSGAQGGGKTTLLEGLRQQGWLVDDFKVSRAVQQSLGWDSLSHVMDDILTMTAFQEEVARQKYARDSQLGLLEADIVLTERTFADIHAYATFWAWEHVDRRNWTFDEASLWLSEYSEMCLLAQKQLYHGVVLLPLMPEVKWQPDPHRADANSSTEIFESICAFQDTSSIPYITITKTTVVDRLNETIAFLETA